MIHLMQKPPWVAGIKRIGYALLGLVPPEEALVFDDDFFDVIDEPDVLAQGTDGSEVRGRIRVTSKAKKTTVTVTEASAIAGLVNVPAGRAALVDLTLVGELVFPIPGLLIPGSVTSLQLWANNGAGASYVSQPTSGDLILPPSSPWATNRISLQGVGTDGIQAVLEAFNPPAWQALHAYTGGIAATGIGDGLNAVVTNGGNLYVCIQGGTSASSGGPSGTGAGDIVDDSCVWKYAGQAGGGVQLVAVVTLSVRLG